MHLLIAILAAIIAANLEAISEICQRQADLLVHAGAWRRDRGIRSGDDSPRAADRAKFDVSHEGHPVDPTKPALIKRELWD
jgi:hypothetical protein